MRRRRRAAGPGKFPRVAAARGGRSRSGPSAWTGRRTGSRCVCACACAAGAQGSGAHAGRSSGSEAGAPKARASAPPRPRPGSVPGEPRLRTSCPSFRGRGSAQPSGRVLAGGDARGDPRAGTRGGKRVARLVGINSAMETPTEASAPGPAVRLGPGTRVTVTPRPMPSGRPACRSTTNGHRQGLGHSSGAMWPRGRPWASRVGLQHPHDAAPQSGASVRPRAPGHLAPGPRPVPARLGDSGRGSGAGGQCPRPVPRAGGQAPGPPRPPRARGLED